MRRAVGVVCLVATLAASASAQTVAPAAGPRSADEAKVASTRMWAEDEAGRRGDRAAIPGLLIRLGERPADERETAIVLDALIRLNASVPDATLRGVPERFGAEVLILASADVPSHREMLFDVAGTTRDRVHVLAAWTLLAEEKAPGIAALLLDDAEVRLDVSVRTPGQRTGVGIGSGSCSASRGSGTSPACDLPPIPAYSLSAEISRASVVLTDGPVPITYWRKQDACRIPSGTSSGRVDLDELRFRLARWMVGDRGPREADSHVYRDVDWTNAAGLASAVEEFKEDRVAEFRSLVDALAREHLLDDREARSLRPTLIVSVVDERVDKRGLLPNLEGVEVRTIDWDSGEDASEESEEPTDEPEDDASGEPK